MPIIMSKIYKITGDYTQDEKEILQSMITDFRLIVADDDPEKNLLNKRTSQYSDDKIVRFFKIAVDDINSGSQKTNYNIFSLVRHIGPQLIISGAVVFSLISEGILQVRNQMDYSDSGLSIGLFNKTSLYQGWAGFFLQQYVRDKAAFKSSIIPKSKNSGFVGIGSEFGYRWF